MLNLHATKKLPSYDSARDLAGVFVDFFNDKVRDIRNSFSSTVVSYRKKKNPVLLPSLMSSLQHLLLNSRLFSRPCVGNLVFWIPFLAAA